MGNCGEFRNIFFFLHEPCIVYLSVYILLCSLLTPSKLGVKFFEVLRGFRLRGSRLLNVVSSRGKDDGGTMVV